MRILITRHARTTRNEKNIAQGQRGGVLSKTGKIQARLLAKRLKRENIGLIISSDALRARQTLGEIRKFHKVPVIFEPLIRERKMGSFVGKSMEKYRQRREKSGLPKWEFKPSGGESYVDMRKRAEKFVAKLKKRKEKCILVVSHGGIIRMIIGAMLNVSVKKAFGLEQENACINIFEMTENPRKGHFVFIKKTLNCRSHLGKFR